MHVFQCRNAIIFHFTWNFFFKSVECCQVPPKMLFKGRVWCWQKSSNIHDNVASTIEIATQIKNESFWGEKTFCCCYCRPISLVLIHTNDDHEALEEGTLPFLDHFMRISHDLSSPYPLLPICCLFCIW